MTPVCHLFASLATTSELEIVYEFVSLGITTTAPSFATNLNSTDVGLKLSLLLSSSQILVTRISFFTNSLVKFIPSCEVV